MIDFRLGRWQDVLADVECDSVICDPPYSERTALGQRGNRTTSHLGDQEHSGITYGFLRRDDVYELVTSWVPRTRRWFVMFGDHITVQWALEDLSDIGWYNFHPIPWVKTDAAPRIGGDGPSPQSEYIAIARSRKRLSRAEKFYRPGWYQGASRFDDKVVMGSKPLWIMRALVRDYSLPGELIADPFAGGAQTLLAAKAEGRRSVGSERDDAIYQRAVVRCPDYPVDVDCAGGQTVLFE